MACLSLGSFHLPNWLAEVEVFSRAPRLEVLVRIGALDLLGKHAQLVADGSDRFRISLGLVVRKVGHFRGQFFCAKSPIGQAYSWGMLPVEWFLIECWGRWMEKALAML